MDRVRAKGGAVILARSISGDATFVWQDLAACIGMAEPREISEDGVETVIDYFFDTFEQDPECRDAVRALCHSCDVRPNCLIYALENKLSGVWGGEVLQDGAIV